jgi:uncharacterized delta-60 repeat protein
MWSLFGSNVRQMKPAPRKLRAIRPRLEVLEDRCLLSGPGSLDPTFGNGAGYVTAPLTGGAGSVLIQPNGDLVELGATPNSLGNNFQAARYNPDGTLDTSFGSNGLAQANFGAGVARGPRAAIYPQAGTANDGKIVQEGYFLPSGGGAPAQILARYNTNGSLDTTFGNDGEVMTTFPGITSLSWANGVVLTTSGQIVALSGGDSQGRFELARYNQNGSLDTTFGQGGYVITTGVGGNSNGFYTLLEQPDGSLIVTTSNDGGTWYLYGFNANGTPNTNFGNQGVVTTTAPGVTYAAALYFNAGPSNDGQIVVVGGPGNLASANTLARYNANGSIDTTFGSGGLAPISLPIGGQQLAIDAAGRVVVEGFNNSSGISGVARFNVNGTLDSTFGNGGLQTFAQTPYFQTDGLAIYPNVGAATDGDILVSGALFTAPISGEPHNTGPYNPFVARLLGQATTPYFTITGPASVTAGTAQAYTISVFNPDGSPDTGYSGTVHITSSDPKTVLPADFTINGDTSTFSATLETAGSQSLTATDTVTSGINGSDASITITPAAAASLSITGLPSSVKVGTASTFTVTALDAYGNTATSYLDKVHFSSSDSKAKLPANYTFTAGDRGSHTFTNGVTFQTIGTQTLTATDTATSTIKGTATVQVVKSLTVQLLVAAKPDLGAAGTNSFQTIPKSLNSLLSIGSGMKTSTDANPSEPSSVAALWQSADDLALLRLDAFLSMEATAMGVTKDNLMRDVLFANLPASNNT